MYENLIRERRMMSAGFKIDRNGKVALVRQTMDLIIELTEPYAE